MCNWHHKSQEQKVDCRLARGEWMMSFETLPSIQVVYGDILTTCDMLMDRSWRLWMKCSLFGQNITRKLLEVLFGWVGSCELIVGDCSCHGVLELHIHMCNCHHKTQEQKVDWDRDKHHKELIVSVFHLDEWLVLNWLVVGPMTCEREIFTSLTWSWRANVNWTHDMRSHCFYFHPPLQLSRAHTMNWCMCQSKPYTWYETISIELELHHW